MRGVQADSRSRSDTHYAVTIAELASSGSGGRSKVVETFRHMEQGHQFKHLALTRTTNNQSINQSIKFSLNVKYNLTQRACSLKIFTDETSLTVLMASGNCRLNYKITVILYSLYIYFNSVT
jgi:hypothetical protein